MTQSAGKTDDSKCLGKEIGQTALGPKKTRRAAVPAEASDETAQAVVGQWWMAGEQGYPELAEWPKRAEPSLEQRHRGIGVWPHRSLGWQRLVWL
jgi:hypothetical protein